jgi:hypothetical protein
VFVISVSAKYGQVQLRVRELKHEGTDFAAHATRNSTFYTDAGATVRAYAYQNCDNTTQIIFNSF